MDDILTSLAKLVVLFIVGSFLLDFAGGPLKKVLRFLAGLAGGAIGRLLPYALLLALIVAPFLIISHYGLHRWIFLGISILTSAYMSEISRRVHELWKSTYRGQYVNIYESISASECAHRSFFGSPVLWSEGFKTVCMMLVNGVRDYEFGSRWGVVRQKCPKPIYIGHRFIVICAVIMFSFFSLLALCLSIVVLSFLYLVRVVMWCALEIFCVFVPRSRAPHCPNCNGQSEVVCSCGQRIAVHPSVKFGLFVWKCTACGRLIPTFAFLRDATTRYECPHCGSSASFKTGSWASGFHWPWGRPRLSVGSGLMGKLSAALLAPFRFVFKLVSWPFAVLGSLFKRLPRPGANTRTGPSGSYAKAAMRMRGRPVALCCFGDSVTQGVVGKMLLSMAKNSGGVHVDVVDAVDPSSKYSGQLGNESVVCRIKHRVMGRTRSLFLLTDTGNRSKLLKKNVDMVMLFVARGGTIDSATLSCPKESASNWLFELGDRMAEIGRCGLMECTVMVLPSSENMPGAFGDGERDAVDFLSRADLSDMLTRLFKHVSYKYLTLDGAAEFLLK